MKVFHLSLSVDPNGQGIRTKQAFDRLASGWSVRSMSASNRFRYPADLPYREKLARLFYDDADVVHLHNRLTGHEELDDGQGKPTILHHHGTLFRRNHEELAAEARRVKAVQLVSTIDLEILEPGLTWLPVPYNADELVAVHANHYRADGVIRIAHAPTDRRVKNTAAIIAAVESLKERYPIELVLIEGQMWSKAMARKATADIFIDQLELGYGCNAVEAWGMGIPVVAGVTDRKISGRMKALWGSLPFYTATEKTLEKRLERLIQSADARDEYAAKGVAHFDRFHDERRVVAQLQDIYAAAPRSAPGPARRRLQLTQREIRRGLVGVRGAAA